MIANGCDRESKVKREAFTVYTTAKQILPDRRIDESEFPGK